jgi:hypothetical protein
MSMASTGNCIEYERTKNGFIINIHYERTTLDVPIIAIVLSNLFTYSYHIWVALI